MLLNGYHMCVSLHAALATEAPTPDLLLLKPHGRGERIINRKMWKHILTQGCYQLFWLFLIIYGANKYIHRYNLPNDCATYSHLDLNYDSVQTLSSVASQRGGTFDVCCAESGCYKANGGLYLSGEHHAVMHCEQRVVKLTFCIVRVKDSKRMLLA